jgi:hypothetical protein
MRRAAHIDANQPAIVQALQATGATVQSLAAIGLGCPDLLVGFQGVTLLMEVKNLNRPRNGQDYGGKVKDAQAAWRKWWRGIPVATVTSPFEAVSVLARAIIESGTEHPAK